MSFPHKLQLHSGTSMSAAPTPPALGSFSEGTRAPRCENAVMRSLWDEVAEIVKAGRRPLVTLSPGMEIIRPKRPRRGRPRVRRPDRPYAHYRDDRVKGGAARTAPKCLKPGCTKRLRVNQRGACCPEHADAVVNDALMRLRAVDVTRAELLGFYEG